MDARGVHELLAVGDHIIVRFAEPGFTRRFLERIVQLGQVGKLTRAGNVCREEPSDALESVAPMREAQDASARYEPRPLRGCRLRTRIFWAEG